MNRYLSILIFSILFFSCSKNKTAPVLNENVKIKMIEDIDSSKKTLTLQCFTEKIFGCSNYYMKHRFSIAGNKITINFIEIDKPDICLTSLGPASATIHLENLPDKDYDLEIGTGDTTIAGQLKVSNASYKVIFPAQSRIQFINPDLNRIPANIIWGTVHYHAGATSSIVQNFTDSLQISGAVASTYLPGNYSGFQIESNGQIKQVQDPGYNFTRYFIYQFSGNSLPLKGLVRRFGINNPNALLITLYTTKGETFMSWLP